MLSLRKAFKLLNKAELTQKERRKYKIQAVCERLVNLPIHILLLPLYLLSLLFAVLFVIFTKLSEAFDLLSSVFIEITCWISKKLYIGIISKEDSKKLIEAIKKGTKVI
jgi:hypothetical protein